MRKSIPLKINFENRFLKATVIFSLLLIITSCGKDYDVYSEMENTAADYAIIPKPAHLEMEKGKFLVDENTVVYAPEELRDEAEFLADMLSTASGKKIELRENDDEEHGIYLKIQDSIREQRRLRIKHFSQED